MISIIVGITVFVAIIGLMALFISWEDSRNDSKVYSDKKYNESKIKQLNQEGK